MKIENIEKIRSRFDHEWLLIAIDEVDKETSVPLRGRLLFHSPRREDIYEASKKFPDLAYIVYSEDWPDDLAACFIII
ncbi:MAG: hypothetical protein ABH871_00760 [Pseudomonadota bacterium]